MVGGIGPVNDELMELLYNKDNSYESGHCLLYTSDAADEQ